MKLFIKDRINFGMLFQEKSDLVTIGLQRSINKKIEIDEEVITNCEIKVIQTNDSKISYTWNSKKDNGIEVDFTSTEITYLKEQIVRLTNEKQITDSIYDLCISINELK